MSGDGKGQQDARDPVAAVAVMGDLLPAALLVHDFELSQITYCNRRGLDLLGHDAESLAALVARGWVELVHPSDLAWFEGARERHDVCGEGEVVRRHFRMRHRDGSWRWLQSQSSVRARDERGRARSALVVVQDVTGAVVAAEQLRGAEKMEGFARLAGGVAHDFNDLLTAIMGFGDLVLEALPGESAAASDLREVLVAARRASAVTEQLIAFCGRPAGEARVVDARPTIAAVEKLLRPVVRKNVELHFDAGKHPLPLCLAPAHLEQLVVNLVVNALDAMPQGGRLFVRLRGVWLRAAAPARFGTIEPGPWAVVEVEDSGLGMSEQVLQHLFEPFFTTKTPGQGVGLGLSTVYGIVQRAGGQLQVRSRPGEGATFSLFLPLAENTLEVPRVAHEGELLPREGAAEAWLVEDDPQVRVVAARALREHGFETQDFASAEEALYAASTGELPHVLVTDVVLPGMSGIELARILQRSSGVLRVLFVSGYATGALLEEVPQSLILLKPYSGAVLAARARLALDGPPASFLWGGR